MNTHPESPPEEPFVPGFENAVFVSYSHLDNQEVFPGDPDSAWVSYFVARLRAFLVEQLGTREGVKVWMDPAIRGYESVTPKLTRAVAGSVTFLPIVSQGYLKSEWCKKELEIFVEAAGGPRGAKDRIFPLLRTDVDRDEWPDAFFDKIGYPFFEKEHDDAPALTLGVPKPAPGDKKYFNQLMYLCIDLAARLESAKGESRKPKCAVFVTEVSEDISELRDGLKHALIQQDIAVLPDRKYPDDPDRFKLAMLRDLESTELVLVVQMFGRTATRFNELQRQVISEVGKPILRWRSPDLPLIDLDSQHLETVEASDVKAIRIEDFKQKVAAQALSLASRESENAFVAINATPVDRELAEHVGAVLGRDGLDFELAEDDEPLKDLVKDPSYCNGVMVVYGTASSTWVRKRLKRFKKKKPEIEKPLPVWAVCDGPPRDKKDPLIAKYKHVMWLDGRADLSDVCREMTRHFIPAVTEQFHERSRK